MYISKPTQGTYIPHAHVVPPYGLISEWDSCDFVLTHGHVAPIVEQGSHNQHADVKYTCENLA